MKTKSSLLQSLEQLRLVFAPYYLTFFNTILAYKLFPLCYLLVCNVSTMACLALVVSQFMQNVCGLFYFMPITLIIFGLIICRVVLELLIVVFRITFNPTMYL